MDVSSLQLVTAGGLGKSDRTPPPGGGGGGGGGDTSTQVPPVVHVWPLAHPPQLRLPPQPLLTIPHSIPNDEQLLGLHTQVPLLQDSPLAQLPQLRLPPQPSVDGPHSIPRDRQLCG